jgi:hypothetical protein
MAVVGDRVHVDKNLPIRSNVPKALRELRPFPCAKPADQGLSPQVNESEKKSDNYAT